MNPLSKTARWTSTHIGGTPVIVAGGSGESAIDRFFREQLKFLGHTDINEDIAVNAVSAVDFASELRKMNSSADHILLRPGVAIVPAYRDSFGGVFPCETAALKSELTVPTTQVWIPTKRDYEDFAFVVFLMHATGRGWKHGFFVRRRDLLLVTVTE
jgi:hypothetical protein